MFWFPNNSIKEIDMSVEYAIWSAIGTVALSIIGIFIFKENISALKIISILFSVLGVIGLNLSGVSH